jgi:hypothetical protein
VSFFFFFFGFLFLLFLLFLLDVLFLLSVGDGATLRRLEPKTFADDKFGQPTVRDILAEPEKPGRDPRIPKGSRNLR